MTKWQLQHALIFLPHLITSTAALGGEKARFNAPPMTPGVIYRQSVCDRYDDFRFNDGDLKTALNGMQLNVAMGNYNGAYFNYDKETGIDPIYPGLTAVIMDELARRAGFTWRDSFGLYANPGDVNATWNDILYWSIDTYDVSVDYWGQNLERMNNGTAFVKEWMDSSMILITNRNDDEVEPGINLWNWTRPFNSGVWMMTIITLFISGVVYQILEWYDNEQNDRTPWQWWLENFYMSVLNFTQAYEYQPNSLATRIFGLSAAMWGLLMTATYTANLASLLIEQRNVVAGPETIEEISFHGHKVCTWESTYTDQFLAETYERAERVPKATLREVYAELHNGGCEYVLDNRARWEQVKGMREFNPQCDLYWLGDDKIAKNSLSGFVTKADSGNLCTGFIRDVLNVHMIDMIDSGWMDRAWEEEYSQKHNIDCDAGILPADGAQRQRRLLGGKKQEHPPINSNHRELRGRGGGGGGGGSGGAGGGNGGGGSDAVRGNGDEATELTPSQMMGTFALHWGLMTVSLVVALAHRTYKDHQQAVVYSKRKTGGEASSLHRVARSPQAAMKSDSSRSAIAMKINCLKSVESTSTSASTGEFETPVSQNQMAAMHKYLQEFQKTVLEEQQALKYQQQNLQYQLQLLIHMSSKNGHEQEIVLAPYGSCEPFSKNGHGQEIVAAPCSSYSSSNESSYAGNELIRSNSLACGVMPPLEDHA